MESDKVQGSPAPRRGLLADQPYAPDEEPYGVRPPGMGEGDSRQIVTHKRFKRLVDQWIDLSIERSRLTMQVGEPKAT